VSVTHDAGSCTIYSGSDRGFNAIRDQSLKTTQLDADSGNVDTGATELASRTIEAALAESSDERAWVLVRLAEDLRALGRADVALRALDAAWELRPSEEPRRAIFTCAISAHCDLDQHIVAEVIEREQAARSMDDEFALAALRLYSALSRMTGSRIHYARRADYICLLAGRSLELNT
jgi:hypothetical protein